MHDGPSRPDSGLIQCGPFALALCFKLCLPFRFFADADSATSPDRFMTLPLLNIQGEQAAQGRNVVSHIEFWQCLANITQLYYPMTPCGNSRCKSQPIRLIRALELIPAATPINSCQSRTRWGSQLLPDQSELFSPANALNSQYSRPPNFCKLGSYCSSVVFHQHLSVEWKLLVHRLIYRRS